MTEIREQTLPEDAASRNDYPLDDGLFGYFAAALAEVAKVSKVGNDQHNPGQPMHWDRSKSRDHGNKLLRHHLDAGKLDTDGLRHTAKRAWRALADLQEELEREGAPIARNARNADTHDHLKKSEPEPDEYAPFRFRVRHDKSRTFTATWVDSEWHVYRLGQEWDAPGKWSHAGVKDVIQRGEWEIIDTPKQSRVG